MKIYLPNPIIELGKITFNKPIYVTLEYVDRKSKTAFYYWDFGMEREISLKREEWVLGQIKGIKNKIIRDCEFDLSHAFFHYEGDPNFTPYHWALRGWFRDRVTLDENYNE